MSKFPGLGMVAVGLSLLACTETGILLSENGSYEIEAHVGSRILTTGLVIASSDSITPSFVSDLSEDPDARCLAVSLETPKGTVVSRPVSFRVASCTEPGTPLKRVDIPSLTSPLPSFSLPPSLAPGFYELTFAVLGSSSVLDEHRTLVYYLSDADLTLSSLLASPSGTSATSGSPLLPVSTPILFTAEVSSDSRLDPWLVWILSGKEIARGRLSGGADRLIWTSPEEEGIFTLRVDLLPDAPSVDCPLVWQSLSIPLATSVAASSPGLPGPGDDYRGWFRFLGSLSSQTEPLLSFIPSSPPRFASLAGSYGLELSSASRFSLPVCPLEAPSPDYPSSRILLSLGVLAPGLILTQSAPCEDGRSLSIILSSAPDGFLLTLSRENEVSSVLLPRQFTWGRDPHYLDMSWEMSRDAAGNLSLAASLSSGGETSEPARITVSSPCSGPFSTVLGGEGGEVFDYLLPTQVIAILDELAYTHSAH